MRRRHSGLLGLALALAVAPAAFAADCARILDGRTTLTGEMKSVGPKSGEISSLAMRIERGDHTIVSNTRPSDGYKSRVEYDRGQMLTMEINQAAGASGPRQVSYSFVTTDVVGDPFSLKEGDVARYHLYWKTENLPDVAEAVTRTVGPRGERLVSGCPIKTVRITLEAVGGGLERRSRRIVSDFAPALGVSLHSNGVFVMKARTDTQELTVETLQAE